MTDFPEREAPERIRPLSQERCELRVGIAASLERKLARVKDLLSQKAGALREGKRLALPAAISHPVQLRDAGQCTAVLPTGKRCGQSRWTQMHHRKAVAQGGLHAVDNLETLCEGHHRGKHSDVSRK